MRFGGLELIVILAIILIIFGPRQLPKLTSAVKDSIASFKEGKDTASETTSEESENTTTT